MNKIPLVFKIFVNLIAITGVLLSTVSCSSQSNTETSESSVSADTIFLFNGKDLSGLEVYIEDSSYAKEDIWSVNNHILYSTGMPFGYIRTQKAYSNYDLVVEWRWPEEPTNSGVLLHMQKPDELWSSCIEAQLKHGRAGDFVAMGDATFKERVDTTSRVVKKYEDSTEKTPGEWNRYDISCTKDSIVLIVNGVLQNKASGSSISEGMIGLQSEGGPMEFKSFYLIPKKGM